MAFSSVGANEENSVVAQVTVKDFANMRSKPLPSARIVGIVQKGDIVTVVSQDGKWTKIQYGEHTGYVKTSLLGDLQDSTLSGATVSTLVKTPIFMVTLGAIFVFTIIIIFVAPGQRKAPSSKSETTASVDANEDDEFDQFEHGESADDPKANVWRNFLIKVNRLLEGCPQPSLGPKPELQEAVSEYNDTVARLKELFKKGNLRRGSAMLTQAIHNAHPFLSIIPRPLVYLNSSSDSKPKHYFKYRRDFRDSSGSTNVAVMDYNFWGVLAPADGRAIGLWCRSSEGERCVGYVVWSGCEWIFDVFGVGSVRLAATDLKTEEIRSILAEEAAAQSKVTEADSLYTASASAASNLRKLKGTRKVWAKVSLSPAIFDELLTALAMFVRGGAGSPKGILLKGPPGTGKTITARAFAEASGANFIECSVATLKGAWIGHTGKNVKEIWDKAREQAPTIIFVDECEGVFCRRGSENTDKFSDELVQTFLTYWDGIGKKSPILVIGATNRPELIDDAMISRFSDIIELLPADPKDRPALLKTIAAQVGYEGPISEKLVSSMNGLSGREVKNTFERAIRLALPNAPTGPEFEEALQKIRGKVSTKVADDATWDTLILPEKTKSKLKAMCQMVKEADELAAKGIPVPKTTLLYGPPGTGKTQIAKTIANEAGVNFVSFSTADLKGMYAGHTANRIKQAFESARANSPAIVFLDEIDAITSSRSGGTGDSFTTEALTQLLQELDGVAAKSGNVLVVAATNVLNQIDPAILSRFSNRFEIGLPSTNERAKLLEVLLANRPIELSLNFTEWAEKCEGYSGRELREAVANAFNSAVERALNETGSALTAKLVDADLIQALS